MQPTLFSDFDHKKQRFVGGMSIDGIDAIVSFYPRTQVTYEPHDLMENGGGGPSTPSKSRSIPSESSALNGEFPSLILFDELVEQANVLYYILKSLHLLQHPYHTPVASGCSSVSTSGTTLVPSSTSTGRRLFTCSSPSTSNPATPTRHLDTFTDEACSMGPTEQLAQLLERQLRSVCKTPYRVLDLDDFYVNPVDWSSTNILGVGLGVCTFGQRTALPSLVPSKDIISSVSWVQKGSMLAVETLSGQLHIYDARTLQLQRTYQQAHAQRVGALAWNVLNSESREIKKGGLWCCGPGGTCRYGSYTSIQLL